MVRGVDSGASHTVTCQRESPDMTPATLAQAYAGNGQEETVTGDIDHDQGEHALPSVPLAARVPDDTRAHGNGPGECCPPGPQP
jgi:hypothetical protein